VTKTTVGPNLLHPLNIITQLGIEVLGKHLRVLSRLEILLPVKEPQWDLKLTGILDDGHELFDFIGGEFSGAFVHVNLGLFANKVGETTSETFDFCEAKDHVTLSFNVGVEDTQNVLEFGALHHRHTPVDAMRERGGRGELREEKLDVYLVHIVDGHVRQPPAATRSSADHDQRRHATLSQRSYLPPSLPPLSTYMMEKYCLVDRVR
jgi:hypothetical protein